MTTLVGIFESWWQPCAHGKRVSCSSCLMSKGSWSSSVARTSAQSFLIHKQTSWLIEKDQHDQTKLFHPLFPDKPLLIPVCPWPLQPSWVTLGQYILRHNPPLHPPTMNCTRKKWWWSHDKEILGSMLLSSNYCLWQAKPGWRPKWKSGSPSKKQLVEAIGPTGFRFRIAANIFIVQLIVGGMRGKSWRNTYSSPKCNTRTS